MTVDRYSEPHYFNGFQWQLVLQVGSSIHITAQLSTRVLSYQSIEHAHGMPRVVLTLCCISDAELDTC